MGRQDAPVSGPCLPDDLLLRLGGNGGASPYLAEGWHHPELRFTWTSGLSSTLRLPTGATDGDRLLELELFPCIDEQIAPFQRLEISVGGETLGVFRVEHLCSVACRIPHALAEAGGVVEVTLRHPDAVRPADLNPGAGDTRQLGFAVSQVHLAPLDQELTTQARALQASIETAPSQADADTSMPVEAVFAAFESLGDNCEFGLVQRAAGVEPLGLLRFSSISVHNVVRGLESGFAGIADAEDLHIFDYGEHHDYMAFQDNYGMLFHTGSFHRDGPPAQVATQQTGKLSYLARRMLEDLEDGDKIFVLKSVGHMLAEQVVLVQRAMAALGGAALLWVRLADAENPAGTVKLAGSRLMVGYLDSFAFPVASIDLTGWTALCRAALALWRREAPGRT